MGLHLITGGSGFVGSAIARSLYRRGEGVRNLDLWHDETQPSAIKFIKGDVCDPEIVKHGMAGVDYVHHTAALVPLAKAGGRYWQTNVEGTRSLLTAARAANVKMFCHMSSSAVFGVPGKMPITNDTPRRPVDIYGRSKLEAEISVTHAGRRWLPVSIIRPRTIVGPGRLGIFEILFDWIRDGANIYLIGSGDHPFQFVHVDDVAEVSIQSALQVKHGFFNVGADSFGTLRHDLGALIDHTGSKSRIKSLPIKPTIAALTALDKLGLSPLAPWHYLTYHKPFWFGLQDLPFTPRHGNIAILTEAYNWFMSNKPSQTTSFHKSPVKQGVLRILKALS
jgi:nucleoside-diphosphate-sugar epimerase